MSSSNFQKRVFVVDDTSFMRAGLIKQLVELGFDKAKIFQYETGLAAIEAFKTDFNVDIIFSDWNMPLMTGIELLKAIRTSDHPQATLPIVMITTVSEKDKVIEALKFKLSGYIIKPVDKEKLSEVIGNVFGDESDED